MGGLFLNKKQRIRDFLKKIGSNFLIQNQNISFAPRGAWQILSNWALCARSAPSEPAAGGRGFALKFEIDKSIKELRAMYKVHPEWFETSHPESDRGKNEVDYSIK